MVFDPLSWNEFRFGDSYFENFSFDGRRGRLRDWRGHDRSQMEGEESEWKECKLHVGWLWQRRYSWGLWCFEGKVWFAERMLSGLNEIQSLKLGKRSHIYMLGRSFMDAKRSAPSPVEVRIPLALVSSKAEFVNMPFLYRARPV